jgi:TonB family protein
MKRHAIPAALVAAVVVALASLSSEGQRRGARPPAQPAQPTQPTQAAPSVARPAINFDFEPDELTLPRRTDAGLSEPDAIEAQVARRQANVRRCFADALGDAGLAAPDAATRERSVTVLFRVQPDGRVTDLSIEHDTAASAGRCVTELARGWRFTLAPGSRATRVAYTWRFES